ncbi:alpha-amylase family protein [Novipirellula artificiosorum]|uniref:Beta-galactosidase trimerization domain protein n=1 Tax=Novipirellula artificiosorum TaxID=2528016 RepID=A0A5C6E5G3_9BACT|nr:alpha-amylase family protein [Novipirellula artificiosorum]TWU42389.1 Beta-galactosidase trimerization domain protein [Novipirellula artificiosorum]
MPSEPDRREFIKAGLAIGGTAALHGSLLSSSAAAQSDWAAEAFEQPFRQVHLDFHTSRFIEGVGNQFDADQFADTLVKAHVNSINCFGRCHHGFIYWDTKAFQERKHPHLSRPILNEQIEACHLRGIRVPIYFTVQWDYYTTRNHPEWLARNADGSVSGMPVEGTGFYQNLCVNTPYRDFLMEMVTDLFDTTPVDGLWPDIVKTLDCSCESCKKEMTDKGFDVGSQQDRMKFAAEMMKDFKQQMTQHIRSKSEKATVFYNAGHIGPDIRPFLDTYSHLEMESLPSGSWGYLHLPLTARFVRTLGKDYLGMTGKFHTSWGDFHSFKNQAALEFECFTMLSLGAKCCVGDQLHPNGQIDPVTYDLIGSVYERVEKKEPWCSKVKPITDIGVLTPEAFVEGRTPPPAMGVVRMLQEGRHLFNMVDSQSDWSGYKVMILPDVITVDDSLKQKLQQFLADGGSILATFESGLDPDKKFFALDALGVTKTGEGPREENGWAVRGRSFDRNQYAEYVVLSGDLGKGLPETEHVMYRSGLPVKAIGGATVLAECTKSYFDRQGDHFSSHRQTPSSGSTDGAAVVKQGHCIYFSHPLFTQYQTNAPKWCKVMFLNALKMLLPSAAIEVEGPSALTCTLNEQTAMSRQIVHLLHYVPERRGNDFDTIEDIVPLFDLAVSVRADRPITQARLVPEETVIDLRFENGRYHFVVPKVQGHQMIELC